MLLCGIAARDARQWRMWGLTRFDCQNISTAAFDDGSFVAVRACTFASSSADNCTGTCAAARHARTTNALSLRPPWRRVPLADFACALLSGPFETCPLCCAKLRGVLALGLLCGGSREPRVVSRPDDQAQKLSYLSHHLRFCFQKTVNVHYKSIHIELDAIVIT